MDTKSFRLAENRQDVRLDDTESVPLTFAAVDGIAFACERAPRGFLPKKGVVANELGPFLELLHLSQDGVVPQLNRSCWFSSADCSALFAAVRSDFPFWLCPQNESAGLLKVLQGREDESAWLNFVSKARAAAVKVGFSRQVSLQLVAALEELVDNVEVHSRRSETGYAAFKAQGTRFDFVVSDRGIGVLKSLRESQEFSSLKDHGDALHLALTDGCSRYGSGTKHGNGFRPLFTGLSNLNGALRFRSGDHALTINGRNPKSIPWTKAAKPKISGFFAAVSCSVETR